MEKQIVTAINSSVWDVQCALGNGFNSKYDLTVLKNTVEVLESRKDSKTMLKLINARIKKLEKIDANN